MISIKSNVQYLLILAVLALPLPEVWWKILQKDFGFVEGLVGLILMVITICLLPLVAEIYCFVYRQLRRRLFKTGNLKGVLLYCGLIGPLISVVSLAAFVGGLYAMLLIGFFLWRDWRGVAVTVRSQTGATNKPGVKLFVVTGAYLIPILWVVTFAQGAYIQNGLEILLFNVAISPVVRRLGWLVYFGCYLRLLRQRELLEVVPFFLFSYSVVSLFLFGFFIALYKPAALFAGVGSFFVMLAIGYFLWQDRKEIDAAKTESLNTEG